MAQASTWMSRKGVTTKRVKTVQTALSRISAQPRSPAGRETNVSRSAKTLNPSVRRISRPGKHCPAVGQARPPTRRARPKRASREQASRPRNPRVPRPMPVRAGKTPRVREFHRPIFIRPTTADRNIRPRPFRLAHDPMSGRSSRPTVPTPRSTRSPF
ncbi:unnamed protein product [Microthlaspi erraticum]|uniref:Uncharacterized protein n=1 Tax=Microthlaspi erraticum TaxID=1685480 RepID=A0A6D2J8D5_9BRAS|nr:unnamed protein product [Microthlaspi erraticum]